MTWKLAEAKNKFSEVVNRAFEEGPQRVTRHGETVVILPLKDFERLSGKRAGLKEYLRQAPSLKGINLERDRSTIREAGL